MTSQNTNRRENERLLAFESQESLRKSIGDEISGLTRLLSMFCRTPYAFITLVGEDQTFVRSAHGLDECEVDRDESFCDHTIKGDAILEVNNALEDERFKKLKIVTGDTKIRFYAGAPLITSNGHNVGALCIMDHVPRQLTPQEREILETMSRQVMSLARLQDSETRLRDLFDNVSDLIQTISPDGKIIWVNRKWQETLGYSESELQTINFFDIIAPGCQQQCGESFKRLLAGEDVGVLDITFTAKDGKLVQTEGHINVRFESGKPVLSRGVFRDVTQQHATQNQMRVYKDTLDATFDAILMFKPETFRFIYANKSALNITGYAMEELLALTPFTLDRQMNQKRLNEVFHQLKIGTEKSFVFESLLRHKNGHDTEVELTLQYMSDDFSERFIAVVRDVTKQRKVRKKLEEARDQAEIANDTKNIFMSRMSHELRTPLNSIIGFSKLLGMGNLKDKERESVKRIHNAGNHLLDLVTDVLDIARVEANDLVLDLDEINVIEMLISIEEIMKPMADAKNTGILLSLSSKATLTVESDHKRLKQILMNLVSNGIKYSPRDCLVTLSAHRDGDRILIKVKDNGYGIPEDKMQRLFTPFDRLDREREFGQTEGTGLGLSISKKLVQSLNGNIVVESFLNRGSTFTVNLPVSPEKR